MKAIEFAELILLGAIWGASFLLMKWAVPEIGVFALVEFRAVAATIMLLPIVYLKKQQGDLYQYWPHLLFVGVLNTAIPFCLFNYALVHIEAGLAAILNGTAPMFGVIVAYLYLKESIGKLGLLGVLFGFFGVVLISYEQSTGQEASIVPVICILIATLCYGITASYLKKHLGHVKPFAIAAGSQFFCSLILLPLALIYFPSQIPTIKAGVSALILGFISTGLAYILYFDLIAKVGASKAITVGYLVPLFGILWGYAVLNETLSAMQLSGGGFIIIGVMLATNVFAHFRYPQRKVS